MRISITSSFACGTFCCVYTSHCVHIARGKVNSAVSTKYTYFFVSSFPELSEECRWFFLVNKSAFPVTSPRPPNMVRSWSFFSSSKFVYIRSNRFTSLSNVLRSKLLYRLENMIFFTWMLLHIHVGGYNESVFAHGVVYPLLWLAWCVRGILVKEKSIWKKKRNDFGYKFR